MHKCDINIKECDMFTGDILEELEDKPRHEMTDISDEWDWYVSNIVLLLKRDDLSNDDTFTGHSAKISFSQI